MLALNALLLVIGDDACFRCFMPIEFLLEFLLIIDSFKKILLVADGLRKLLYIYDDIPA